MRCPMGINIEMSFQMCRVAQSGCHQRSLGDSLTSTSLITWPLGSNILARGRRREGEGIQIMMATKLCRSRRQAGWANAGFKFTPPHPPSRPSAPQLRLPAPTLDTLRPRPVSTRPHPVSPTKKNTQSYIRLHNGASSLWAVPAAVCSVSFRAEQCRAEQSGEPDGVWRGLSTCAITKACSVNMERK